MIHGIKDFNNKDWKIDRKFPDVLQSFLLQPNFMVYYIYIVECSYGCWLLPANASIRRP